MSSPILDCTNFPCRNKKETDELQSRLDDLLRSDLKGTMFSLLAEYTRILTDNSQRDRWPKLYGKLDTLFRCGRYEPLDGPMLGVSVCIRDSDYFRDTAKLFGNERSVIAKLETLATAWNATFANSSLWTGKTFEPIEPYTLRILLEKRVRAYKQYDNDTTRIGRNFFRNPICPNPLETVSLPLLTELWDLHDRPQSITVEGFHCTITEENLIKERIVPYQKTGGYFLATVGTSVVPEVRGKQVYQLNYRWGALHGKFPMSRLVDELVQIGEGIYLGQLVLATKNFSVGTLDLPFTGTDPKHLSLGREYDPFDDREGMLEKIIETFTGDTDEQVDYAYQHNGYFLMMDPAYAELIFAEDAFPALRPTEGEIAALTLRG
ncbi:MAG: hypothetical protein JW863_20895 [Chitinispirillaceae bacterium]|nr:hypothetical protein [Chitinispirillaceae bacterium]